MQTSKRSPPEQWAPPPGASTRPTPSDRQRGPPAQRGSPAQRGRQSHWRHRPMDCCLASSDSQPTRGRWWALWKGRRRRRRLWISGNCCCNLERGWHSGRREQQPLTRQDILHFWHCLRQTRVAQYYFKFVFSWNRKSISYSKAKLYRKVNFLSHRFQLQLFLSQHE